MAVQLIFGYFIFFIMALPVVTNTKSHSFKFQYCNPKFVTNCSTAQFEKKDGGVERRFQNFSFITLVPIGNNFSIAILFSNKKGNTYRFEHKFCDVIGHAWFTAYVNLYQRNIRIPCPLPRGLLELNNLVDPPPRLPVPLLPGDYEQEYQIFHTKSKVRLATLVHSITLMPKPKKHKHLVEGRS